MQSLIVDVAPSTRSYLNIVSGTSGKSSLQRIDTCDIGNESRMIDIFLDKKSHDAGLWLSVVGIISKPKTY